MPEKEQNMFQKEYGVDSTVVVDLPASLIDHGVTDIA